MTPSWQVGCDLSFSVEETAAVTLQVAVAAAPGRAVDDRLSVAVDGRPLDFLRVLAGPHGGWLHHFEAPPGQLDITYRAAVSGPVEPTGDSDPAGDDYDRIVALRPSRYCPSDALLGFAAGELGGRDPDADLLREVVAWIGNRVAYIPGSSGPLDSAVDTLLSGQGVCRDFAHLAVGLARALGIPARLVAAYAPGLSPMDFHAVVEAHVEGAWHIVDPTHLAPRASLLRIATGRDAADTAFADVVQGVATLDRMGVRAVLDGELPRDEWGGLVALP